MIHFLFSLRYLLFQLYHCAATKTSIFVNIIYLFNPTPPLSTHYVQKFDETNKNRYKPLLSINLYN